MDVCSLIEVKGSGGVGDAAGGIEVGRGGRGGFRLVASLGDGVGGN